MPAPEPIAPVFLQPVFPQPGQPPADYAQPAPPRPEPPRAEPPPPTPAPSPVPVSTLRAGAPVDLIRKLEIEAAMFAAPQDVGLRATYFEQLGRLAIAHTGLQTALLPDLGAPLYFRCGTPDVAVLAAIFRDGAQAFEMRPTPRRILVIGAYAGYATVDLAHRFPHAEILALEPMADNFRLLTLNTAAWRRIRVRNIAAWHHTVSLAPTMRLQADWAIRLHDEAVPEDRTIPAFGMAEILDEAGWPSADMVVCDASGAEREVFADPRASWLDGVDAALVKVHEQIAPRAAEWVAAALDRERFEHCRVGEAELFVRRVPLQALPPTPPDLPLIRGDPGLTGFMLADVPQAGFGFFVFEGGSCQVHPNRPGGKPARAMFTVTASGQRRFVADVLHAGRPAEPVLFTAAVQREDGSIAGRGQTTLCQRESGRIVIDLGGPVTGTARVVLQTEMAPGTVTSNMAWARWLDPRLV